MSYKFATLTLMAVVIFSRSIYGQEMTEKYIPIGAYPSLAATNVTVGTIVSADRDMKTFALRSQAGVRSFLVSETTRIWLDRSLLKRANEDGTFTDIKAGLKAEVSVLAPQEKGVAKWVKVQVASQ